MQVPLTKGQTLNLPLQEDFVLTQNEVDEQDLDKLKSFVAKMQSSIAMLEAAKEEQSEVDLQASSVKLTNSGVGDKQEKCEPDDSSDLPEGWTRFRRARPTGERYIYDTYIENPEGMKFDRQKKINQYLRSIKSNLKIRFMAPSTLKSGKTSDTSKAQIAPKEKQPEVGKNQKRNTKKGSTVSLNETSSGTKDGEIRRSRRNSLRI